MIAATFAKINDISPNNLDHADLKSVWLDEPTGIPVKVLQSENALH